MPATGNTKPLLVAADMGYGHLRAAHSLADAIGTEVDHAYDLLNRRTQSQVVLLGMVEMVLYLLSNYF